MSAASPGIGKDTGWIEALFHSERSGGGTDGAARFELIADHLCADYELHVSLLDGHRRAQRGGEPLQDGRLAAGHDAQNAEGHAPGDPHGAANLAYQPLD